MAGRAAQACRLSAVLVTGGEGYIGRATCEALTRAGFEPVSIDLKGQPAFRASAWDYAARAEIVRTTTPIGAIHLAAHSDAAESVRDPDTLVGDPKRACEVLGWSPAYSLDEMIVSAWSALHGSR